MARSDKIFSFFYNKARPWGGVTLLMRELIANTVVMERILLYCFFANCYFLKYKNTLLLTYCAEHVILI